jgi:MFS family permease
MAYRVWDLGKTVSSCNSLFHYFTKLTNTTVFNHPIGSTLGIYGAMPGFGGLAVLMFAPYIADNVGRRNGTAIGCLFVILGALLQAFPPASNPAPMYLAGRFFIGFGGNLTNGTCPLLITEISHPRHRGRTTTIYNTLWYLVRQLSYHTWSPENLTFSTGSHHCRMGVVRDTSPPQR